MSEGKKVSNLITIGSKKAKADPKNSKALRLNLKLFEPSKKGCPVFDFEALIKKDKDEEKVNPTPLNGNPNPFNSNDDDDDVQRIAKQFEAKYGTDRRYTYAELGAGYDESDSFIDNTEICDEELLDENLKKYQGYYINKEKFECNESTGRRSSEDTDGRQKRRRKAKVIKSESETDSSESSNQKKAKIRKTNAVNGRKIVSESSQSNSCSSSDSDSMKSKSEESISSSNQIKNDNSAQVREG